MRVIVKNINSDANVLMARSYNAKLRIPVP